MRERSCFQRKKPLSVPKGIEEVKAEIDENPVDFVPSVVSSVSELREQQLYRTHHRRVAAVSCLLSQTWHVVYCLLMFLWKRQANNNDQSTNGINAAFPIKSQVCGC